MRLRWTYAQGRAGDGPGAAGSASREAPAGSRRWRNAYVVPSGAVVEDMQIPGQDLGWGDGSRMHNPLPNQEPWEDGGSPGIVIGTREGYCAFKSLGRKDQYVSVYA